MPDLKICFRNRVASVDIDDLDIQSQGYTLLALGNILANEFPGYPVRALSRLWGQDARVIAREENCGVGVGGDASQVGLVVGVQDLLGITSA